MEFIQKIQATNPEVAPVLVSATSRDRLEDAYPRMPVPFMRKPIDFRKLLTVIGRGGVH
jgi:DNA-binding NtrC family response regulator